MIALLLREAGHALALWNILTDELIGVLTGASLPDMVRSSKVKAPAQVGEGAAPQSKTVLPQSVDGIP